MGKFYEALRRSGAFKEQQSSKNTAGNLVKISTETAQSLVPDSTPLEIRADKQAPSVHGIDPRLCSLLDPSSAASECFKMLRTKLLVKAREKPLKSILVTSAEPQDGKTLVAANLAVSIAQDLNDYVLLVDCDIRAPFLHRVFNLDVQQGIGEYLKDGTSLAPFLARTSLQKLTLLPAGKPSSNPSELLCSTKMRALVEELKARYDDRFIIFDSPPGQFMAETAYLAGLMDGILLVVRYGKTRGKLISDTIENLGQERVLGVVFNASQERQKDYKYYYSYYMKKST